MDVLVILPVPEVKDGGEKEPAIAVSPLHGPCSLSGAHTGTEPEMLSVSPNSFPPSPPPGPKAAKLLLFQAFHLIKAVSVLLNFSQEEENMLKETLEYKVGFSGLLSNFQKT